MSTKSLQFKLALGAIALVALLVLAQALSQYFLMRGELARRIESQDMLVVSTLAAHLDDKFNERTTALVQAGTSVPIQSLRDIPALERHLKGEAALLTLFDDLYLFDAKGVLLVDWPVKPGRRNLDMASRDYIQGVIKTKAPVISKPILGKATKDPIIVLAAPVLDAKGELVAIIGGVLNLYKPNLVGALAQRRSGQTGYFFIVSPDRTVIAHPDRSRILKPVPPGANLALDRALEGFEGTMESVNSLGVRGLTTFHKMESTGWILASMLPLAEAYAPIQATRRQMIVSTLVLLLVGIAALWAFSRHLVHPLGDLARAVHQTASHMVPGQASQPVPETGSTEIQTVARAFNGFLAARNAAEGALAASEQRMSVLIANVHDGIWDWDVAQDRLFINPAMHQMLGLETTPSHIHGGDVLSRVHPDDLDRMQRIINDCITGDADRYSMELRLIHANGKAIWVEASGSVIKRNASGMATHLLGTMVNISERQEQLVKLAQAKSEAEAASKAKSNFLANMSHEIRTPMNGILGMTGLCLQTPLTAEQRSYLDMVDTSAHSLLAVINDILDFSKIEAQKLDLDPHPFGLREMLRQTIRALSLRAAEKGLELVSHVDPSLPDTLVGDRARLQQVLTNLLGNAVKFTTQGEVVLRVCASDHPASPDTLWLDLSVSDTGIGIPRDKQASIFDAFTQADASTARRFGGSGLGLAISRSLVHLMGGTLTLKSVTGRGSHFTCTVPLGRVEDVAAKAPALAHSLPGTRVLVVEDNSASRTALHDLLLHLGCDAVLCRSAAQALAHPALQQCALVVVDSTLADTPLPPLIHAMRLARGAAPLPIVLMGAFGQRPDLDHGALDLQGYIAKPLDLTELHTALHSALQPAAAPGSAPTPSPAEPARPPTVEPATTRPPPAGLNVLLAEDTLINQKLVTLLLERMGHQVTLAQNGVEAVNAWHGQRFDLILMDIQMPEMGGVEATQQIRAHEADGQLPHTPIIALTANALKGDRELYMGKGMDGYVSKPIAIAALKDEIARVTGMAPTPA